MNIFGSILDKLRGHKPAATAPAPTAAPAAPQAGPTATAAPAPAPAPAPMAQLDVEAVLNQMADMKGGGGNWRTSIVDLLNLLGLDHSLAARRALAGELGVRAGEDGSAEQNIALYKAVMQKLAENGGVVPDSMRT